MKKKKLLEGVGQWWCKHKKMKGGDVLGIHTCKANSFQIPHRKNRKEGQGEGVCRKSEKGVEEEWESFPCNDVGGVTV